MTKAGETPAAPAATLQETLDHAFAHIDQRLCAFQPQLVPREVGTVASVITGIARVQGLPGAGFEELLLFPGGLSGIAFNLDEDGIDVVLLGDHTQLCAGQEVHRAGRVMDVAVGDGLLGRVIDPLGRPLDGLGRVVTSDRLPIGGHQHRRALHGGWPRCADRLRRPHPPRARLPRALAAAAPPTRARGFSGRHLLHPLAHAGALDPFERPARWRFDDRFAHHRDRGAEQCGLHPDVLSPSLFELGVLPAIDVGQSVSRVGGKAQRAAYRAVAGDLKLAYAQFEELETFARFGARLDDDTRLSIEHGRRIRACLGQAELSPVSVPAQIAILLALNAALFDPVPLERMVAAQQAVQAAADTLSDDLVERLTQGDQLTPADRKQVTEAARQSIATFLAQAADPPDAALQPAT